MVERGGWVGPGDVWAPERCREPRGWTLFSSTTPTAFILPLMLVVYLYLYLYLYITVLWNNKLQAAALPTQYS